jgi:hypothetical protein
VEGYSTRTWPPKSKTQDYSKTIIGLMAETTEIIGITGTTETTGIIGTTGTTGITGKIGITETIEK